jgi:hypothetical protein
MRGKTLVEIFSNETMLYRHPGAHRIHGDLFDYTVVDASREGVLDLALKEGWYLTPAEAKAAANPPEKQADKKKN